MRQRRNTPRADTDIISVCDGLMVSLQTTDENAEKMIKIITEMKERFSFPSIITATFCLLL